jgi:hypothetical protein
METKWNNKTDENVKEFKNFIRNLKEMNLFDAANLLKENILIPVLRKYLSNLRMI